MSKWFCGNLLALGCLVLAGCGAPPGPVTPAEAVAQLRTGRPLLNCREACVAEWQRAQPQAAQLAAGRRWADLAALTVRIGYQDDLSLYYLGQAAEGLLYPAAAASYYRQSTYLSGTAISCQNLSRVCGGMEFPRAALLRLAAIERSLSRPAPRRAAPGPQEPGAPAAVPEEIAAPGPGEAEPAAPAEAGARPPPEARSPFPAPVRLPPTEYIEPPPAAR